MSWSGTVTCRHCYKEGHNRRTCPAYTEQVLRHARSENDLEGHWTKQYMKRTGLNVDGTKLAKVDREATKSTRRCNYCGATGHNKRTCQPLKDDRATYVAEVLTFRKSVLEAAKEAGCGVGALLKTERYGDVHCWMITQIEWNSVAPNTLGGANLIIGQDVKTAAGTRGSRNGMVFPSLTVNGVALNEVRNGLSQIVGPVIVAGIPADYLTDGGLDSLLARKFDKEARSSDYWNNRYE